MSIQYTKARHKAPLATRTARRFSRPVHFLLRARTLPAPPPLRSYIPDAVPDLTLPAGYMAQRTVADETESCVCTQILPAAVIGFYDRPRSLQVGDEVRVNDPDDLLYHGETGRVAEFSVRPDRPVGVEMGAQQGGIAWFAANRLEYVEPEPAETLVMAAVTDDTSILPGVLVIELADRFFEPAMPHRPNCIGYIAWRVQDIAEGMLAAPANFDAETGHLTGAGAEIVRQIIGNDFAEGLGWREVGALIDELDADDEVPLMGRASL